MLHHPTAEYWRPSGMGTAKKIEGNFVGSQFVH